MGKTMARSVAIAIDFPENLLFWYDIRIIRGILSFAFIVNYNVSMVGFANTLITEMHTKKREITT